MKMTQNKTKIVQWRLLIFTNLVLEEILDLDGLSVLFRFVLSLKSVMLFRGTTTPPLLVVDFDDESTFEDLDDSSRLDLRNVFVCKKVDKIFVKLALFPTRF